jgi:hypothetical protein
MRKFVNIRFTSVRKEATASKVRKLVERDPTWSWLLVGSSSYINEDVGIMCGDSKLRQINHRANSLVYLFVFLLYELLE